MQDDNRGGCNSGSCGCDEGPRGGCGRNEGCGCGPFGGLFGTIFLDGLNAGTMKTNLGGKLVLSVEISNGGSAEVKIVKC